MCISHETHAFDCGHRYEPPVNLFLPCGMYRDYARFQIPNNHQVIVREWKGAEYCPHCLPHAHRTLMLARHIAVQQQGRTVLPQSDPSTPRANAMEIDLPATSSNASTPRPTMMDIDLPRETVPPEVRAAMETLIAAVHAGMNFNLPPMAGEPVWEYTDNMGYTWLKHADGTLVPDQAGLSPVDYGIMPSWIRRTQ